MPSKGKKDQPPEPLRVSSLIVMDEASLKRARAKAEQHKVPFPQYLEEAVKLYGQYLDKKISAVPRPI